jgi:hypothetical protein
MSEKIIWFKRKKFGWGWTPSTWQGWLITLAFPFVLAIPIIFIKHWSKFTLNIFYGYLFSVTAGFFFVLFRFGESPKWSWGDEDQKDKK